MWRWCTDRRQVTRGPRFSVPISENANTYSESSASARWWGRDLGPAVVPPESWAAQAPPISIFLPHGSSAPLRALLKSSPTGRSTSRFNDADRRKVPPCELGVEGEVAPQLGWITWANRFHEGDPGDTI